jgi:hypothetical protein
LGKRSKVLGNEGSPFLIQQDGQRLFQQRQCHPDPDSVFHKINDLWNPETISGRQVIIFSAV